MRSTACLSASPAIRRSRGLRRAFAASLLAVFAVCPATAQRFDGVNVIAMPAQPFGSAAAKRSAIFGLRLRFPSMTSLR